MNDIVSFSNYVINSFDDHGARITNLKLQKTLYYIQGYFLKVFGKAAFDEDIQHWTYGPVVPLSYYAFNHYGANQLEKKGTRIVELSKEQDKLAQKVIDACIRNTSVNLVNKTHSEEPWMVTSSWEVITKDSIRRYFRSNDPLEICKNG